MKKYLCILLCLAQYPCFAQMNILSSGLNILSGTLFSIDSMVLVPSVNLSLTNNTITKVNTPVSGTGGASIQRVHRFATPVTFSGLVGLRYSAAELNGNAEGSLELVYNNLSTAGTYVTTTGSTRAAAGSYYVSNTFSSMALGRITATNAGIALPLALLTFSARAAGNCTAIVNWTTTKSGSDATFVVEASADGRNWLQIPGQLQVSGYNYEFTSSSPGLNLAYYRLQVKEISGEISYSNTRMIVNPCESAISVTLVPNPVHNQCRILSAGGTATLIRIYDGTGRQITTLKADAKGEALLDMSPFPAGTYLAECMFDAKVITTRFTKE